MQGHHRDGECCTVILQRERDRRGGDWWVFYPHGAAGLAVGLDDEDDEDMVAVVDSVRRVGPEAGGR